MIYRSKTKQPDSEIPTFDDVCGKIRVLTSAKETDKINLVEVVANKPAMCHFHRKTTEIYYVVEGEGWVRISGRAHGIKHGSRVIIQPGDCHQLLPKSGSTLKVLVMAAPAWQKTDEFKCEEHNP